MKIMVAGQPKAGNVWLKHILASLYDLTILSDIPEPTDKSLGEWVRQGKYADYSIFHQHFWPTDELFNIVTPVNPHVVTLVRNPYDAFVSLYHFIQRHQQPFLERHDPAARIIGLPLDHPTVLDFLGNDYAGHLQLSRAWMENERSVVARYEFLHADPVREVTRIANQIQPVRPARIRAAIKASRAHVLKKRGGYWNVHIRTATVGDWQRHLISEHFRVFRSSHADLIKRLGYQVQ